MLCHVRATLIAVALLTFGAPACAQPPRAVGGAPFSFAPLVKRVVPAVVNIAVVEGAQSAV